MKCLRYRILYSKIPEIAIAAKVILLCTEQKHKLKEFYKIFKISLAFFADKSDNRKNKNIKQKGR